MRYTVVAAYREPPSIFCTTVDTETIDEAVEAAWEECVDGNGWDPEETTQDEEWTDTMVIKGDVEVVA